MGERVYMDAFLDDEKVRVNPTNIIFQIPGRKEWFRINENSSHDYPEIVTADVQRAKMASIKRRRSKKNTSKKSKTPKKSGSKSRSGSRGSGKKPSR